MYAHTNQTKHTTMDIIWTEHKKGLPASLTTKYFKTSVSVILKNERSTL